MAVPVGLLAPVFDAGEDVRSTLRTGGQRAWIGDDGRETVVPVWAVSTNRRLWLIATSPAGRWVSAIGDPDQVRLEHGWVQDTLVVGRFRMPVRRTQRAAAEALVAAFRAGGGGGAPVQEPGPSPTSDRAAIAVGAVSVPAWVAETVVATTEERWLHAARTRATQPFGLDDGRIERGGVFVASTDRRTVLAARIDAAPVWWAMANPTISENGRILRVGPRDLRAAPSDARMAAALASTTSAASRWALVARAALADGDAPSALRLLAQAHALGHRAGWPVVARLLFGVHRPSRALSAARRALDQGNVDVLAEVAAVPPGEDRQLARQQVDAHLMESLLADPLAELPDAPAIDGMPWPPASPRELWAAALADAGRPEEALRLWEATDAGERRNRALAALLQLAERPGAADAWERAARQQRDRGPAAAVASLDRALQAEPTAPRRWLRAAWAFEDGHPTEADAHWATALAMDPDAGHAKPTSSAMAVAAAEMASRAAAWGAAEQLLNRAIDMDSAQRGPRLALARVLAEHLHRPTDGAEQLDALLAIPAGDDERDGPALLLQARYRLEAGDPGAAGASVRAALTADYLHADVWAEALDLAPAVGIAPDWWRHVRGVLSAEPPGAGRPPTERLSAEELDELHPGGVGWVDKARLALSNPDPPARKHLIRGLETLRAGTDEALIDRIRALSRQLELDPPDAYLFRGEGAYGVRAWATRPPVLLIGADHVGDGPRKLDLDALSFLLAVELVHLACDHPILAFDSDLIGTSRSAYRSFGRFAGTAEDVVDVITLIPGVDQLAKLQRVITLSRKAFAARTAMDKVSGAATSVLDWLGVDTRPPTRGVGLEGLKGAAMTFRIQADRAALLLTGNLAQAVDAILTASSRSVHHRERVRERGLAAVLSDPGPPPEALRLGALVEFAASLNGPRRSDGARTADRR